jgi:hypothetical protein
MSDWESILEDYLDGSASRATAEGLRFRIALPFAGRAEVETVLRLADCITDAMRSTSPPAGAANRLLGLLTQAGEPERQPNWSNDGGEFIAPLGTRRADADEDACNAAIESGEPGAILAPSPDRMLEEFQRLAASARESAKSSSNSMPAGAVDRLRSMLSEAIHEEEADPAVARRILSQLRGEPARPPKTIRPPDVLAAGEEPEEETDSDEQPEPE